MAVIFTETTALLNNTDTIADALKAAFSAVGYGNPLLDTGVNPRRLIYEHIRGTATYARIYIELRISAAGSFYIDQRLGTGYDPSIQQLINPGDWSGSGNLGFGQTWTIQTFSTTEFQFVVPSFPQYGLWVLLGVISPAGKPTYWDDEIAPYFFCSRLNWEMLQRWQMAGVNPYYYNSAISADFEEYHYPTSPNPFNQTPDLIPQILFVPESREGLAGISSADFGRVGDGSLTLGTIVQVANGDKYMVIGNYGASQPVIRVNLASLEGRTVVNGSLLPSISTDGGNQGTICRFVNPPPYPDPTPCNYNAITVGQLFPR